MSKKAEKASKKSGAKRLVVGTLTIAPIVGAVVGVRKVKKFIRDLNK